MTVFEIKEEIREEIDELVRKLEARGIQVSPIIISVQTKEFFSIGSKVPVGATHDIEGTITMKLPLEAVDFLGK